MLTRRRVRTASGEARRLRARAGFSMIELIVAITILIVGILGLAGTAAVVMRQISGGQQQSLASAVAQSRLELLAGQSCSVALGGSAATSNHGTATTRGITEKWWATKGNYNTMTITDTVTYTMRTIGSALKTDQIVVNTERSCP